MKNDIKRLSKLLSLIVSVLIFAALLAGCTPSSDGLSSLAQPSCLKAIPVGKEAVGNQAHFAGLRYMDQKSFISDFTFSQNGKKYRPKHLGKLLDSSQTICIVAWTGNFSHLDINKFKIIHTFTRRGLFTAAVTVTSASKVKLLFVVLSSRFSFGFSKIFPHVFDAPTLR